MTIRRGSRPAQVRPRPAPTGRPTAATPHRSHSGRLPAQRRVQRGSRPPLYARLGIAAVAIALGFVVLVAASGLIVRVVGGIGGGLSGAIGRLTATPAPSAAAVVAPDAPALEAPAEPYTNQPTADVSGTVPGAEAGRRDARIRLYASVGGTAARMIGEQPVGGSVAFTFPAVALKAGSNMFTATVVSGGRESGPSAAVSYVLDTKAPSLSIASPDDGVTINRPSVTITGRTQARSQIVARDADSNTTATGTAATDGTFSVAVALASGTNEITVTSTDPAGNVKTKSVTVRRGTGKLKASLSASVYRFSARKLPDPLTVRVTVVDPDGHPLDGAAVTFTISIPGVPTITAPGTTDADGKATFATTIPRGASVGTGPAAVLVHTDEFGETTDRTVIAITK